MNNQDPFAKARPKTNEKPDQDQNDPFFNARPESYKEQFKKPFEGVKFSLRKTKDNRIGSDEIQPDTLGEIGASDYEETHEPKKEPSFLENLGQAFAFQSQTGLPQPKAVPTMAKSAASGATFGFSELIPGMKVDEKNYPEIAQIYKFVGSVAPIGLIQKAFAAPGIALASKSPIAAKGLAALADITGWGLTGASVKTLEDLSHGKMPSAEEVLQHGAEWAVLDGILKGVGGVGGKFVNWVLGKAESTKKVPWQVVNDLLTDMKKEGIDIAQEDRVTAKVLSLLEQEQEYVNKGIKLSEKPKSSKEQLVAKETLRKEVEEAGNKPIKLNEKKHDKIQETAKEKIGEKAQNEQVDLSKKKITPMQYDRISAESLEQAKPYVPKEVNAEEAIHDIESSASIEKGIEEVSERAETSKKLGESIQTEIETAFHEAEKAYEPLYKDVREGIKNISHKAESTIELAKKTLEELNKLKTKPEGYRQVINTINDTLSDLGHRVIQMKDGSLILSAGKPLTTTLDISLSDSMELARRLNKIIDYDIVGPSIKNKLKPIVNSLKNDIKQTLKKSNPELFEKFVEAEKRYGETAERFSNENVQKVRGNAKPEKIATSLLEPTVLENLKKTTSPRQYRQIEREILESIRGMNHQKAEKAYRELKPHLSEKSQKVAESILNEKAPHGKTSQSRKLRTGVIEDLNKAFSTGKRPEKVLNLWKTVRGQKLIEESLEGNPNKKEILDYLKKQSLYDFAQSVIDKSGSIDFKKFNEYLKDPATIRNLSLVGGESAVAFFKSLENLSKMIDRNIQYLEKIPTVKIKGEKFEKGRETLEKAAGKLKKPKEETRLFKESIYETERPSRMPSKTELPKSKKHERGEEILEKASERAKQPTKETRVAKEIISKEGKKTSPSGQSKLKEAAKKSAPFKFKMEEFSDKYGFTPEIKQILKMLGLLKFTGPYVGLVASKFLYRLATKPSTRKSIKRLIDTSSKSKNTTNITPFITAISDLED